MQKHLYLIIIILILQVRILFSQSPWPGEPWQNSVNLTSLASEFQVNLSGAHWNPLTRRLWVCVNGPGSFCALKEDGKGSFIIDSVGGKPAKWIYSGDMEGITQADLNEKTVFLIDETNGKILEFDVSTAQNTKLIHSWNINPDIPAYANLLGPEGIVFVPDEWLVYNGFTDKDGLPYVSTNGMGGIILIAHQNGGHIYAFDLNRSNDTYKFIGKYATNRTESSGLEFDRSTGKLYIWHSPYENYIEITEMKSAINGSSRKFIMQKEFYGPKGGNLEGIAMTPASTNENWYFAADDSNQDGYALMWFKDFKVCLPEPFFEVLNSEVCVGDTVTFINTSIGGCETDKYSWDAGEGAVPKTFSANNTQNVVYTLAGNKTVKLVIKGNISDSLIRTEYVKVNELPEIPTIKLQGDTIISSLLEANRWYFNDSLIEGYGNNFIKVIKIGYYKVEVINASGCRAMSNSIYVDLTDIGKAKSTIANNIIFRNYPTELEISNKEASHKEYTVNIYNLLGQKIYSCQANKNLKIDGKQFEDKIVIVQISDVSNVLLSRLLLFSSTY